jgi:hypothetical protein
MSLIFLRLTLKTIRDICFFYKTKTNVFFLRFNETLGYSWFGWVVQGVAQGGKKVTAATKRYIKSLFLYQHGGDIFQLFCLAGCG